MSDREQLVDALAGLALFGDLPPHQLESVAHTFSEESVPAGQRILRQGFAGTGFYVILDGQVAVRIDGEDRATLGRGDFFGEMSLLLGEPPVADVVALGPLRLLHLGGPDLEGFLKRNPTVMYRMLQSVARRLRNANRWRS
jgi:CRP-like cAMP-binding protein